MKRFLMTTLVVFLCNQFSFAQQTIIAKFIVTDARANGHDVTNEYTSQDGYYVFYTQPGDTSMRFASVMAKPKTESYGPAYNMQSFTTPKTDTEYETDHFTFTWSYANTYDTHKGTAKVKLLKIGKPDRVAFELTIITENLDIIESKGYMDGTLNLPSNK
jgi:hypothetical protein